MGIENKLKSICSSAKSEYKNAEYGTAERTQKRIVSMILEYIAKMSSPDTVVDMLPQCVLNEACGSEEKFGKLLVDCTEGIVADVAKYINKVTK